MIITVTMNPAIDRTLEIDSLVRGGLNRIGRVEYDAGGKGINVSRTIKELGGKTICYRISGRGTAEGLSQTSLRRKESKVILFR